MPQNPKFETIAISRKRRTREKLKKLGRSMEREFGVGKLPVCTIVDLAVTECLNRRRRERSAQQKGGA